MQPFSIILTDVWLAILVAFALAASESSLFPVILVQPKAVAAFLVRANAPVAHCLPH